MNESGPAGRRARGLEASSRRASACAVKLDVFEGPLDLLLHLIRLNEVDVHDIPIAAIAEQYVEYLSLMRELNLDVAGEYLLMAATLAWIKSRMLLPPSEEGEEDEGGDPRAELVARLLEYQRFREVAEELGAARSSAARCSPRRARAPSRCPRRARARGRAVRAARGVPPRARAAAAARAGTRSRPSRSRCASACSP